MKKRSFLKTSIFFAAILVVSYLLLACNDFRPPPPAAPSEKDLLPIEITVSGRLEAISDRWIPPPIRIVVQPDTVEIIVGVTERYQLPYAETEFAKLLQPFQRKDFQFTGYHQNPYLQYGKYVSFSKVVDSVRYQRVCSGWVRKDIDVRYTELPSAELARWADLSNHANALVVSLLADSIDRASMITAYTIEEALQNPERVYELNLRNARLTGLPSSIGQLKQLRVLNISGSRISALPPEIAQCTQLRSIVANATPLSTLPVEIGELKHLRFANFGYCQLQELPREIGDLASLWQLSLGSNLLQALPESFAGLKNLRFCSLENNRFTQFPEQVLGLASVDNLWLHGNQFTTLPPEIAGLKRLTHLLIDAHEITNVDAIQALLPGLRIIDEERR